MKGIVSVLCILLAAPLARSQDSWRVLLNNKLVLTSHVSDETVNRKAIRCSEWKKNGYLEVNYREEKPSNWIHSLRFTDEGGNVILTKDSVTTLKILTATLRKKFTGKKQMMIYMVISPPNPMMAAPSRIIHLATLKLP